ncbi:MAG TPA: hypothetical protein VI603_02555 [Saprospiraceae bacterium]|nr:hypothetical protein [Saprospiraceae bacterium]
MGVRNAGLAWSTKPTSAQYFLNRSTDSVRVATVADTFYPVSSLYKVKTTDEDGNMNLSIPGQ